MASLETKLTKLNLAPMRGEQFKPMNTPDVDLLESTIGMKLPEDYVSFLMKYGACCFELDCRFPTSGGGIYPGWFFDVDEIVAAMQCADDFLPKYVVPINDDGGGNNILSLIHISEPTRPY